MGTSILSSLRDTGRWLNPALRRLRAEIAHLASLVPSSDRVLDLGSGTAPYAHLFPHRQFVTTDLLSRANVRSEAGALPFTAGAFDLVLCTEVLEHVPDPDRTLDEIHRLLGPSGALVLTTPLTYGIHEPRDYHRWTEMGLRQILERHGFTVLELRPRGGVLLSLSALLLVVPWQLLGDSRARSWWQSVLFVPLYALVLPTALILGALDGLDRRRDFTPGYVVLCRPASRSPSDRAK